MEEIAGVPQDILNISPTVDGSCASDPQAAADTSRCWWTCGGCTNTTQGVEDIVTCPNKMTWGLSFDDGPAPYSPKVLRYLSQQDLTATFFIVGSRVMERPDILQAEYMLGHHIAAHTWSHSVPLTALSNEQVVAELAWSREAIREVTGVSPLFMRPPWGDIDNRVRAISLALGMRPIIWTRDNATGEQFDTNDWRVVAGQVTGIQSNQQFQSILSNATTLDTGFIVLQHDLWEQEVDLATGYSVPQALAAHFNLMDINKCLGQQPSDAYLETIANKSNIPTFPGAGSIDVSGNGTTTPGTGSPSTGTGTNTTTSGDSSAGGSFTVTVPWSLLSSLFISVTAAVTLKF
jgi:peptidoglycan/xylan/chitin deacetylase (PgdA/CDA1 family)